MKSPMKFKQKTKEEYLTNDSWKVLIVDDDQSVHTITTTVLEDVVYDEKRLKFFNAYSAKEAKEIISKDDQIALILLDVVMESDQAGLEFANFVRDELKNRFVRIVLRTGQPGVAPQKDVIDNYGINDYKEKTDLTAQKLYTTVVASLRNYKELRELDAKKVEVHTPSTQEIYTFSQTSLDNLISTLAQQAEHTSRDEFHSIIAVKKRGEFKLLATTNEFKELTFDEIWQTNKQIAQIVEKSLNTKSSFTFAKSMINYYEDERYNEHIIYIDCNKELSQNEIHIIEMFAFNFSLSLELYLR